MPKENIKKNKLPTLKERMQATQNIDAELEAHNYEKSEAYAYCDALFVFWQTGTLVIENTHQVINDVAILIKIWENKKEERYFNFWSKAFGGKK